MQGTNIDVRQLFEQHRSRRSWAANPQTSARLTCQVAPGGVAYHSTSLERSERWHWFVWLSVRRPSPATLRQKQTRQSLLTSAPMVQEAREKAARSREGYSGVRTHTPSAVPPCAHAKVVVTAWTWGGLAMAIH